MSDLNQQIEDLLKEMKEIKENQKAMTEKMEKMQQVIDHIESDIYSDEGFDFEIVCPYCEYEFVIDADENKKEIQCPECKNTIELDWSGDLDEDDNRVVAPICRFTRTIRIRISRNTINIFRTNTTNNLTLLNKITNRNNKIRGNMTIRNFKIIKRKSNGISTSTQKRAKSDLTISNSN